MDNKALIDFVTNDLLNNTSLFAVKIIDLDTYEIVFANQSMKSLLANDTATKCWEATYGQTSRCSWCKVNTLLEQNNSESIVYENFNETANKWYQIQEKILTAKTGGKLLVSFAIDISLQKEAQSQLINTHVQLSLQTKALEEVRKVLKEQASHDYLTGLYNRRYFQQIAQDLINLSRRETIDISVIMLDIDRFKIVNDTYGHSAGDTVLKHLASTLTQSTRDSDIVARFGGEEFTILLLNTTTDGAAAIAEKLRKAVDDQAISIDDKTDISLSISLGVSSVDVENDKNIDAALNRSDKALYKAKRSGRNKVIVYSSSCV